MRLPIILGSVVLVLAAGSINRAAAQGIQLSKLKQMTAPFVGGSTELLAIGYEADTVDSDEKPSLFGFSGHIDISGNDEQPQYAFDTGKPNGDCLTCELRDDSDAILTEEFAAIIGY